MFGCEMLFVLKKEVFLKKKTNKQTKFRDQLELFFENIIEETTKRLYRGDTPPFFLTERAFVPRKQRERFLELLFETFELPATYLALDGLLAIYASGRGSGVSIDVGRDCTTTTGFFKKKL